MAGLLALGGVIALAYRVREIHRRLVDVEALDPAPSTGDLLYGKGWASSSAGRAG